MAGGETEGGGGEPAEGGKPTGKPTAEGETTDQVPKSQWTERATKTAFSGVDLEQLYKDWMADKTK